MIRCPHDPERSPVPEGDSVHQLSARMQFMCGREVTSTSIRVPRYATVSFTGETVGAVWPLGKHLFMSFGDRILHTHLKMEGTWSVHRKGARWRKPGHAARVVLQLSDGPDRAPIEVVGFDLGLVRVFPASEYRERMGHLGPDVLYDDWAEWGRDEARRRILARPDRAIGAALLDQRNLAGVGNEYRAEICFLCGVHPAKPVSEVDVDRVLDVTRRLMWANRVEPVRVTTGVKRAGETTYVFGRNHRPCRRCGSLIEQSFLGGVDRGGDDGELERVIWWCPHCQPVPDRWAGDGP
nr:DNA-formamidopyrimidine glycosylase family protein [Corynebacterium meridianum]